MLASQAPQTVNRQGGSHRPLRPGALLRRTGATVLGRATRLPRPRPARPAALPRGPRRPRRPRLPEGAGGARVHKGSARPGPTAPPRARPVPPRPARGPRLALAPPPAEAAAGAVPDAPHCLRGAAALERPPRARNPSRHPRPRPGQRPRRPLLRPAGPVRSDAPRQPRAPARRLPAERRRPSRARDPARGGAGPRGCIGPARPGPAGPWTGQCRGGRGVLAWRGRGRAPRWKPGTALRAARGGPTRLPGRASRCARRLGAWEVPGRRRLAWGPCCPGRAALEVAASASRAAGFRVSLSPHAPAPAGRLPGSTISWVDGPLE